MKFIALIGLIGLTSAIHKKPRITEAGPTDGAGRPIYDADGDGVEDNIQRTREELDRFYLPNYFFPTEDIYNTQHGNLPGHVRKAEYEGRPNYRSPYFHPDLSDGKYRTNAGLESRGDGTYDDVFNQNGLAQLRVPEIHQDGDISLKI